MALAALQHLEQRSEPANPRLARMRRQQDFDREILMNSERWLMARDMIQALGSNA